MSASAGGKIDRQADDHLNDSGMLTLGSQYQQDKQAARDENGPRKQTPNSQDDAILDPFEIKTTSKRDVRMPDDSDRTIDGDTLSLDDKGQDAETSSNASSHARARSVEEREKDKQQSGFYDISTHQASTTEVHAERNAIGSDTCPDCSSTVDQDAALQRNLDSMDTRMKAKYFNVWTERKRNAFKDK